MGTSQSFSWSSQSNCLKGPLTNELVRRLSVSSVGKFPTVRTTVISYLVCAHNLYRTRHHASPSFHLLFYHCRKRFSSTASGQFHSFQSFLEVVQSQHYRPSSANQLCTCAASVWSEEIILISPIFVVSYFHILPTLLLLLSINNVSVTNLLISFVTIYPPIYCQVAQVLIKRSLSNAIFKLMILCY